MFIAKRIRLFLSCFLLIFSALFIGEAHAERFFQEHSTWYEKIPANPTIAANSAESINDIVSHTSYWGNNDGEYSVPIFHADANTPVTTVTITHTLQSLKDYIISQGWNKVPIPNGALPAGNTASCSGSYRDGHMVVISYDGHWAWDFFQGKKCGSNPWTAKTVRKWDLTTNGVIYPHDDHGLFRAAGVPLTHGIVTYDDYLLGVINHALAFDYYQEYSESSYSGIYPAGNYREWINAGVGRPYALKVGQRLQLNPSYDCNTVTGKLNKMICVALQQYGMIFVDSSSPGYSYVFIEHLNDQPGKSWSGINVSTFSFPLSQFRVIEPLTPSLNTSSFPNPPFLVE